MSGVDFKGAGSVSSRSQIIIEQVQLAQFGNPFGRKVSRHAGSANLQPANPAAEAQQMDHFFVAQIEHGCFDILLGDDQFFAEPAPIGLFGQIEKLLGVPTDSLLNAQTFSAPEQFAAEWFDGL